MNLYRLQESTVCIRLNKNIWDDFFYLKTAHRFSMLVQYNILISKEA